MNPRTTTIIVDTLLAVCAVTCACAFAYMSHRQPQIRAEAWLAGRNSVPPICSKAVAL
jgi:hypothetical protein